MIRPLHIALALAFLAACTPPEAENTHRNDRDAAISSMLAVQTAVNLRKSGRTTEAVTMMREARMHQPGDPQVLAQLGYALIAANKPEDAVNVFDELIAIEPDSPRTYNGKAVAFDSAGNHAAAQELYQKALALAPDSPAIRNNLGMSMILNGEIDEATRILEPLVTQPNATATMRQNLALAYGIKGDRKRALELNLQDVKPEQAHENVRFYEHYARLLKEQKSRAKPVALFTDTPENTPGSVAAMPEAKPVTPVAKIEPVAPVKSTPPPIEEEAPAAGTIAGPAEASGETDPETTTGLPQSFWDDEETTQ